MFSFFNNLVLLTRRRNSQRRNLKLQESLMIKPERLLNHPSPVFDVKVTFQSMAKESNMNILLERRSDERKSNMRRQGRNNETRSQCGERGVSNN